MARIYNVNPVARNDTDSKIIETRDWLVNHSNGNLTAFGDLETVDSRKCIHLRFKDSDLYIRISQYSASNTSVQFSVHTRANEAWSTALSSIAGSNLGRGVDYSLEYAEIDNCLFRIGAFQSGSSDKISMAFFCFSLHGTDYIGLCGNSVLSFFNFGNGGYTTPYPMIYNTAEHTSYSTNMFCFTDRASQLLAPSDAILCPVLSYIRASAFERGVVEWAGFANKNLYYLLTPTGSHIFQSEANYIINGVSYKACACDLFVFL